MKWWQLDLWPLCFKCRLMLLVYAKVRLKALTMRRVGLPLFFLVIASAHIHAAAFDETVHG